MDLTELYVFGVPTAIIGVGAAVRYNYRRARYPLVILETIANAIDTINCERDAVRVARNARADAAKNDNVHHADAVASVEDSIKQTDALLSLLYRAQTNNAIVFQDQCKQKE